MLTSDIWDNQTSARILRLACHRKICQIINGGKSNRKAMNRNWSNQKANPALKTKEGNKKYYK